MMAMLMAGLPARLRLSRAKGFDLQRASRDLNGLSATSVARPGRWGNPFVTGRDGTRAECVELFAMLCAGYLCFTARTGIEPQEASMTAIRRDGRRSLRGRNLACWCSLDGPCHADVLLSVADTPTPDLSRFASAVRRPQIYARANEVARQRRRG